MANSCRGQPLLGLRRIGRLAVLVLACLLPPLSSGAFEGRITATLSRGADTQKILYTVAANDVRIERTETNWPHAINLISLAPERLTLVFPHNRSFVRVKETAPGAITFNAPPPRPSASPVRSVTTRVLSFALKASASQASTTSARKFFACGADSVSSSSVPSR